MAQVEGARLLPRLRGELEATRSQYDEAVDLYDETLLHALQEVADGLNNWKETGSIIESHIRLLVSAQGEVGLTHVRLRSGYSNGIEFVHAIGARGGPLGLGDQNARMGIGQSGFAALGIVSEMNNRMTPAALGG